MKWKKIVLKGGQEAPTKPKGRPKKNSIPTSEEIEAEEKLNRLAQETPLETETAEEKPEKAPGEDQAEQTLEGNEQEGKKLESETPPATSTSQLNISTNDRGSSS